MTHWTYPEILRLKELRSQGRSYSACARAMRCSRSRISGAVRRYIHLKTSNRSKQKRYEEQRRAWKLAHPPAAKVDVR